jgi:hypothetical protein
MGRRADYPEGRARLGRGYPQPAPTVDAEGLLGERGRLFIDEIALLFADTEAGDPELIALLSELRRVAAAFYDEVGSPQEEFWMTTEALQIVTE